MLLKEGLCFINSLLHYIPFVGSSLSWVRPERTAMSPSCPCWGGGAGPSPARTLPGSCPRGLLAVLPPPLYSECPSRLDSLSRTPSCSTETSLPGSGLGQWMALPGLWPRARFSPASWLLAGSRSQEEPEAGSGQVWPLRGPSPSLSLSPHKSQAKLPRPGGAGPGDQAGSVPTSLDTVAVGPPRPPLPGQRPPLPRGREASVPPVPPPLPIAPRYCLPASSRP